MNETAESGGSGCAKKIGIGCLVLLILLVVIGIGAYVGIKKVATRLVAEYTDTAPRDLPAIALSPAQVDATLRRVDAFGEAIRNDVPVPPLSLTGDEINALIEHHPNWSHLAGKARVAMDGSRVRAEISMPLDTIGPMGKGRYLNGSAAFDVSLVGGQLVVYAASAEVRGKPIPEPFMTQLKTKNLAEDANQKPETAAVLSRLESISIQNNAVTIMPKKRP